MSKYILTFCLVVRVLGQGSYGQTGNSQIGGNTPTAIINPTPTVIPSQPNNSNPTSTTTPTSTVTPTSNSSLNYGQNGNSQIGANTTPNTPSTSNNSLVPSPINSQCGEADPLNTCISKSTCCHVSNFYSGYSYSACVDVKTQNNFRQFCNNFYSLNAKEGFSATECICYGNVKYTGKSFSLQLLKYLLFLFTLIVLL